ncbi:MAG: hypothetical protein MJ070_01865 [Lachnospiraceae bacterium]|nr:hypothetical protein [Lachnospiraceae bacterium]
MRKINWSSDEDSKLAKTRIIDIFLNKLNGKTAVYQLGSFLFLYWFPPWSLGTNSRGTPNHNFVSESFCFVGFIHDTEQGAQLSGISFYSIVFRILVTTMWVCGVLLTAETPGEAYVGLIEFGAFSLVAFELFKRSDEDDMNERVKQYLRFQ